MHILMEKVTCKDALHNRIKPQYDQKGCLTCREARSNPTATIKELDLASYFKDKTDKIQNETVCSTSVSNLLISLPEPSVTFSSFDPTNSEEVSTLYSPCYSTTSPLDPIPSIISKALSSMLIPSFTEICTVCYRPKYSGALLAMNVIARAEEKNCKRVRHYIRVPQQQLMIKKQTHNIQYKIKTTHIGLYKEMHKNNISYIFILGFPNLHSLNCLLFLFLLIVYCVTICGNVIIIFLVSKSNNLHSPMYFFIRIISLLDIMMTTDILPNLLHIVLHNGGTVSLVACILQFFVFGKSEVFECLILTVMSYDRYVAICNPLRYSSIINRRFCEISVIASWSLSFLLVLMNAVATYKLDFCGPNVIDHFFCDFTPIIELSCSDTAVLENQTTLIVIIALVFPFIIIFVSYVYIITTILSIRSISGRQKAFSTCSSHLTVVCIFFGSLITVYIVPTRGQLRAVSKILSLLYTVVTPLLNPFIYSLRNKDLKKAFEKCKWNLSDFMNSFRHKREKRLRIN
ncbi:olfactory receptor 6C3-like [Pseudophryne corroboree]|uniref:olfactory receptor 6C3-like n=1 Tax=Pseudophryne corroboree TaxID=495146 RepID=UPI003081D41E